MLCHAPVIQDQSLRGTSSWGNAFLQRDHTALAQSRCASHRDDAPPPVIKESENRKDVTTPADSAVKAVPEKSASV
jgi:hypothetical protein